MSLICKGLETNRFDVVKNPTSKSPWRRKVISEACGLRQPAMGQEHRMHGFVFAIPPGGLMTRVEEKRSLWISERLVDDSASCRDRKSVELVDPGD
ncbi:hypothetical protein V6N13_071305 [Hibiscus sabdariffa]